MKKNQHILVIFVVVLLLTLTSPFSAIAQNPTQPEFFQNPTQPENKIDGFPVMLDGKLLFFVRRGVSSFSRRKEPKLLPKELTELLKMILFLLRT